LELRSSREEEQALDRLDHIAPRDPVSQLLGQIGIRVIVRLDKDFRFLHARSLLLSWFLDDQLRAA
jgi:hypothetical protein